MGNVLERWLPWAVLALSFLFLAVGYGALPADIVVYRPLTGSAATLAPKSLFTVFRVPFIELICGLAVETMRWRVRAGRIRLMWTILLHTTAFKSLFQSLEMVSEETGSSYFFYATIAAVAAGVLFAAVPAIMSLNNGTLSGPKLNRGQVLALGVLLVAYGALAFAPIYLYG